MMAERSTIDDINNDRISELPRNLIDKILNHVTIGDVARTSILSKNWRFLWVTYPQLVFDKQFFEDVIESKSYVFPQTEFLSIINKILLLHSGPILKFILYIPNINFFQTSDMDQWILVVSRNGIRELTIENSNPNPYKVPTYIFSCVNLTYLKLCNCILKPMPAFGGFCTLISLYLKKISFYATFSGTIFISSQVLESLTLIDCTGMEHLTIHAPNLLQIIVKGSHELDWRLFSSRNIRVVGIILRKEVQNAEQWKAINLITFFHNLPMIEILLLDGFSLKFFAVGTVPKWLPTSINQLRTLALIGFRFDDIDHIFCGLCFLRNSPNLQKLEIHASAVTNNVIETVSNYLEAPDCMDQILANLRRVELKCIIGLRAQLLFIKLLLASSPSLERMTIELSREIDANEERKVSRELMRFRRASTKAEIICLN